MPVTDESNVLEGLSFVTPNGGKGALCSHISQHMVKSLSELEKSHSWRFGPQRSETFSRVAELRHLLNYLYDILDIKFLIKFILPVHNLFSVTLPVF